MSTGRITPFEWTNQPPISGHERVLADPGRSEFQQSRAAVVPAPLTTLVADRQPVVREGLRSWLRADEFEIVAEVDDAAEAAVEAERLCPEIAILGASASEHGVVAACVAIADRSPGTATVVLADVVDDEEVLEVALAGARALLSKETVDAGLPGVLRRVAAGEQVLDLSVAGALFRAKQQSMRKTLTAQELKIVRLAAEGCTNREIGRRLYLSRHTVKDYLSNAMREARGRQPGRGRRRGGSPRVAGSAAAEEGFLETPLPGGGRSPGRPVAAGAGRPDHGRVRVCALVAVIACGVLAVPATARSDPFSLAQLQQDAGTATIDAQALQQANTAIAHAQALASQELTATRPTSGSTSTAGVEEAAKVVSHVIASVEAASTSATVTPPPREQRPASPPAAHPSRHRSAPRLHRSAASVLSAGWARPVADTSSLRTTGAARSAGPPRAAARRRGSARSDRSADLGPHRLPPLPVPPQGLNGTTEGGGSAPPPLVAALAALVLVLFEFMSRLLPRSAFRKPRRLALPPWHPG